MGRMLIILVIIVAVLSAVIWHHQYTHQTNPEQASNLSEELKKYSSSTFDPEIRVHLTTRRVVPFKISSPFEIHSLKEHQLLASGEKTGECRN